MAVNDVKIFSVDSLANNSTLALQPTGTEVDRIITLSYTGAVEVYIDNQTTNPIISDNAAGIQTNLNLITTNTSYYTVKNVSGGTISIRAKGQVLHT